MTLEIKEITSFLEVPQGRLVDALTNYLLSEKLVETPAHTVRTKTAAFKENTPEDPNWFVRRSAAILRRLALKGEMGVGKLAKVFGALNKRRISRNKKQHAAKGHIRKALQLLEAARLAEKGEDECKRKITDEGFALLNKLARELDHKRTLPLVN